MSEFILEAELKTSLKPTLDRVSSDHIPFYVKREHGEDVVIIPKDYFSSMDETDYLLSSPKNAARLREALKNVKQGNYQEQDLME